MSVFRFIGFVMFWFTLFQKRVKSVVFELKKNLPESVTFEVPRVSIDLYI